MNADMLGEELPLCIQRIAREVRGRGVLGARQIEEKVESAGFLVFLRGRNTVEPLEETRQGGACGGGAGGGWKR